MFAHAIKQKSFYICIAAALLVGAVGGLLTDLGPWYQQLIMPSWQPPDSAFPIVWTSIFVLSGSAAFLMWQNAQTDDERHQVLILFGFNALLNILWSFLFFTLHRPDLSLYESFALLGSIVMLMNSAKHRSRAAIALLTPYLLWVGFAIALNTAILKLNY